MKYVVTDPNRLSATRTRLDAVAHSDGPVDPESAAFGGLAHAIRLDHFLYRGRSARPVYRRLAEMGKGQWSVAAATSAVASAQHAAQAAALAARAASDSAIH